VDTIALYRTHQHQWIREGRKVGQAGRLPNAAFRPRTYWSLIESYVLEVFDSPSVHELTGTFRLVGLSADVHIT
jgi:hypothetical protein